MAMYELNDALSADDFYKNPEDACYPVMRVTRNPDGSYDVRRSLETQHGKAIYVIGEDHYVTAADLPASIPAEMR